MKKRKIVLICIASLLLVFLLSFYFLMNIVNVLLKIPSSEMEGLPKEAVSYDDKYNMNVKQETAHEMHFVNIEITDRITGETVYLIENGYRAFDFGWVTWENESNNFWVKSGDLGTFCYCYKNGQWEKYDFCNTDNGYVLEKGTGEAKKEEFISAEDLYKRLPLEYAEDIAESQSDERNKPKIVKVDGFSVEYVETGKELTIEDFQNIELGSTWQEVYDAVGKEDTWVGSGMIKPVWFLKNERAVMLSISTDGLIRMIVYDKEGNSQIIKENVGEDKIKLSKVEGVIATWEYIERDISLDYFYKIDNTVTYKQIEEEIGKPNGERGSGLILPYYQVGDLYVVISFSLDENGEYNKVGAVFLCTKDECLEQIYPR